MPNEGPILNINKKTLYAAFKKEIRHTRQKMCGL